eukprot:CAMPEP_0168179920 /NCGR_PEP_ID=MMETSP0139_2-20121125/10164_1 /TAXON_ID=44445 /ORGANISM="Pseudo-nitzschia australis, Strain 10249 10 AB" /LENGTH=63 /DNA_ID=CAMNT_0008099909 /DNA_START=116 /DNA_END=307 /DNA_ORIENTATION=+
MTAGDARIDRLSNGELIMNPYIGLDAIARRTPKGITAKIDSNPVLEALESRLYNRFVVHSVDV